MPMYNLIEYSDNYCDTSGSLSNFKRDEINNTYVTHTLLTIQKITEQKME